MIFTVKRPAFTAPTTLQERRFLPREEGREPLRREPEARPAFGLRPTVAEHAEGLRRRDLAEPADAGRGARRLQDLHLLDKPAPDHGRRLDADRRGQVMGGPVVREVPPRRPERPIREPGLEAQEIAPDPGIAQAGLLRPLGEMEEKLEAVTLIPGAGEFAYHTNIVRRIEGAGRTRAENAVTGLGRADVLVALDELQMLCPNLKAVSIVSTWFGSDLRADHCRIEPRVEVAAKTTSGATWSVGGNRPRMA